jgi:uncharacterized protein with von Willebrand factor type A (vWA) domain
MNEEQEDKRELLDCSSGKYKSTELVCHIARKMQESDNLVSFSEIEDALHNIEKIGSEMHGEADLKDVLRPALAKSQKAQDAFDIAFPKAMEATFSKVKKTKNVEEELEELQ